MVTDISVTECLKEGWEYYKRHLWLSVGTLIVMYAMMIVGMVIPLLGILFAFLVTPVLSGGMYFYFLNVARDSDPKLEDIFAGFKRYGTLTGLYFLYLAVICVGMLPSLAMMIIGIIKYADGNGPMSGPFAVLMFSVMILNILALVFGLYRYWMVYFVIMDEPRLFLVDALKRSSEITKGSGHNVIMLVLASFGIGVLLFVALIIPAIIFGPMLLVAMARCYLKLKEMHEGPAGVAPEGPVVS